MIKLFRSSSAKWLVFLADCLFIYVSYWLAYSIKFHNRVPAEEWNSYLHYAPWLGVLMGGTFYFFNLYDMSGRQKLGKYRFNLVLAHLVIAVELIMLSYWFKGFILPRSILIIGFVLGLWFTVGLRHLFYYMQSKAIGKKRALIVIKDPKRDLAIVEKVQRQGNTWFEIQKVCILPDDNQRVAGAMLDEIDVLILNHDIPSQVRIELIRQAGVKQLEVVMIPDFYELYLTGAEPQQIDDLLVYSIMPPRLSLFERFAKRAIDLAIATVLLLIASPVMVLMFIVIPTTSRGKALFVQERVGLHEKQFNLMKFRSMVDNAEKGTGPVLARDRDPRITRLGQFIRATRIDELPQLINVMRGEMSLVGPRPEREFFITQFKEELPHYGYRLMVKPGLTGLAQVRANYTTMPSDKLRYDLLYIKNYSPMLDLKILFQTIMVVLQREQSKGVLADQAADATIEHLIVDAQMEMASSKD
ncbi:sugar transferase [Paenibacillus glycinis]|uniref:Exopolysaccharide biosynthesis polyprenyl glycosylphosphotransferase n=1 Tax=Paenibacillus glycinis TaxID=2697035 RepID=A0ABW9XNK6_9BACL|nr:sugar transferase [Paenibacillus glycinis]NBD24200.1 exopolysaccharide biosynthesis polyprenyl glycosylphosphotransferase [Paenibacillus glycinis]